MTPRRLARVRFEGAGALVPGADPAAGPSGLVADLLAARPRRRPGPDGVLRFQADDPPCPPAVPAGAWRRMSRLARLATAAGAPLAAGAPPDLALVWGSAIGEMVPTGRFLDRLFTEGPEQASPLAFQNSVYNAAAGHLGLALGLTGPAETLSAGGATGLAVLLRAARLVASGASTTALAIAADDLHPILERSWDLLGHRPPPGEACAALRLSAPVEGAPAIEVWDGVPPGDAPLVARRARLPDEPPLDPLPHALAPEAAWGLSPCLGLAALAAFAAANRPVRVVDRDGPMVLGASFTPGA